MGKCTNKQTRRIKVQACEHTASPSRVGILTHNPGSHFAGKAWELDGPLFGTGSPKPSKTYNFPCLLASKL